MLVLFDGETGPGETLRFIEEKLGFGLFAWDVRTNAVRWSNGMFALLDLPPGSVEPNSELLQEMTFPEDRWTPSMLERAIGQGLRLDREFRIIRRNGRIRWLASYSEVLMGNDGKPNRVIGAVVDTTTEHDFHSRVEFDEQRRRALVEAAHAISWMAAPDGKIIEVSNWTSQRVEDSDALMGEGWLDSVHPDDRAATAMSWSAAVSEKRPYCTDHRVRQPDGTYRWYRSSAVPLLAKDGSVFEWVGISYDIHHNFGGASATDAKIALAGEQIRGARGILNWSVRDLADASGVSPSVVRRLEEFDGITARMDDPIDAIRHALEQAGIEFLHMPDGKPGLRRR